jgi:hypothetical protein
VIEEMEGPSTEQKLACVVVLGGIARKYSGSAEAVANGIRELCAHIERGTWAGVGIEFSGLEDPTPELRTAMLTLVGEYIDAQLTAARTSLAEPS